MCCIVNPGSFQEHPTHRVVAVAAENETLREERHQKYLKTFTHVHEQHTGQSNPSSSNFGCDCPVYICLKKKLIWIFYATDEAGVTVISIKHISLIYSVKVKCKIINIPTYSRSPCSCSSNILCPINSTGPHIEVIK